MLYPSPVSPANMPVLPIVWFLGLSQSPVWLYIHSTNLIVPFYLSLSLLHILPFSMFAHPPPPSLSPWISISTHISLSLSLSLSLSINSCSLSLSLSLSTLFQDNLYDDIYYVFVVHVCTLFHLYPISSFWRGLQKMQLI